MLEAIEYTTEYAINSLTRQFSSCWQRFSCYRIILTESIVCIKAIESSPSSSTNSTLRWNVDERTFEIFIMSKELINSFKHRLVKLLLALLECCTNIRNRTPPDNQHMYVDFFGLNAKHCSKFHKKKSLASSGSLSDFE